jgi:hypothetical protein
VAFVSHQLNQLGGSALLPHRRRPALSPAPRNLHIIPRYAGDGWTIIPDEVERERSLLDSDAQAIKDAIASTD